MSQILGISPDKVTAAASAVPEFKLGTLAGYDHPTLGYQEFIYGQAAGAITGLGYLCLESTGFDFAMATSTTANAGTSGHGTRAAAAQSVMADNDYGWFQIYGKGSLRTLASAAKGTRLNTTATAGAVDDDATVGAEVINGIVLLTATAGAAATNADAMFNYPSVGVGL